VELLKNFPKTFYKLLKNFGKTVEKLSKNCEYATEFNNPLPLKIQG
jgi:hypothetical protein